MAPHGYIPFLQERLIKMQHKPRVLEIGIDRGVTLIPLVVAIASQHDSFLYMGVDVNVQESLNLTLQYLGPLAQFTYLIQENSLSLLPKLINTQMKFDVIILDGDHNYHTVSQELNYLDDLVSPDGIVVIDDYDGKWSERDLWYAERPGYEENALTTKPVSSEKQGVKPAVDDWLEKHADWLLFKPIPGEPVILSRQRLV